MRWDSLFADLEAQLEAERRTSLDAEVAERVRIERGSVSLRDRLRAHVGAALVLDVGRLTVRGTVATWGRTSSSSPKRAGGYAVVPLAALEAVSGLGRAVAPAPGAVLRRLGLASALRGLVRDRTEVRVLTASTEVRGVPAAVAADHLDLVPLRAGDRDAPAGQARSVPLPAVRVVRSR